MSALRQFTAAVDALDPVTLKGTVKRIAGDVVEIGALAASRGSGILFAFIAGLPVV